MTNLSRGRDSSGGVGITLLGGFRLVIDGHEPALPFSVQRVLAAIALRGQDKDRTVLGAMIYPDGRRSQVSASLRSALWRAKRAAGRDLVDSRGRRVRLVDDVDVDLPGWTRQARAVVAAPAGGGQPVTGGHRLTEALSLELLPGWEEDWLTPDRQRWNHLRLHTLERLAAHFAQVGRHMEALEAGLAAVAIEPFRETAHRALIGAYIAEGNSASALAQYHRYQRMIRRELGVRPTAQLEAMVSRLTAD
jgi:DNA-binding SARP family transcriptional activator